MDRQKTALVTGANSGLGLALSAALADRGFHVLMLCRSYERGMAALRSIATGNRSLELCLCDLGSLSSIHSLSEWLHQRQQGLDVLVNNAGVITLDRRQTVDGFELQLGVNHLGHFSLSLALLDLLAKAEGGRIVVYSSGAHRVGRIHFHDIHLQRRYSVIRAYSQSKLANLLFCQELARRLSAADSPVTVNACHPGAVATEMGVDRVSGFGRRLVRMLRPFFQTPEQGCQTALYLATDPGLAGQSGGYYYRSRLASVSRLARDHKVAVELFALSEALTGRYYPKISPTKPIDTL